MPCTDATARHRLITRKEAAGLLRVSTDTLDGLVHDGELAYVNVGRGKRRQRRMFIQQDVEDFIERRRRRNVAIPIVVRRSRISKNTPSTGSSVEWNSQIAEQKRRLNELLSARKNRR